MIFLDSFPYPNLIWTLGTHLERLLLFRYITKLNCLPSRELLTPNSCKFGSSDPSLFPKRMHL